ncbi:sensor histidine kinase [Oceanobacillus chungangensis]|uniref:histidine kinase n=1 Tax=Oceanobacillus chungangensis TaxID=1229152 RepID=A0A3D8PQZ6_9BACI|nr:sensor histidine kinase [Oceanobacillus chungangensis]RDW17385.1 sensor histidine kinase [Oceanobacillus chungangensis]
MQTWYHIFPKKTGISLFAWIAFCLLPFYFIFKSSTPAEIIIGILMILLFFITYRLAFIKKGWTVYVSVGIEMAISIGMTVYFGYVYFSLFLAFFIGNIQNRAGFIALYVVNLVTTVVAVGFGFFTQEQLFFSQIPFIVLCIIGVILLPFEMYNRVKREKLEIQLEDANERISKLMIIEERQRIARDLHDTLGQKLSLIGLKSDLASKLVVRDTEKAKLELYDINQTARTALKEVREIVSTMRSTKLVDELISVQQVLEAAQVKYKLEGDPKRIGIPVFVENVLSMCLKEAATNVVKHSKATFCKISLRQSSSELTIIVEDNGIGMRDKLGAFKGHGLEGMRERLEFVNGTLQTESIDGMTLTIKVPTVIKQE